MDTLDSMFETSARCHPSNIAVTFNSGNTKEHVTYQELDLKASKVAEFLNTLCEDHEVIAVYCKQSIGFVACILGVLKHKSCFAPIDLNWPPNAICSFLSKLNVSLVLVDKELLEPFQQCLLEWSHRSSRDYEVKVIKNEILDANGFLLVKMANVKLEALHVNTKSLSLAYIMQTSGTTGEPKAVKVPHRCIAPNITDLRAVFQVMPNDVVFLASPYTFDPFIVQMFIAFAAGARLVIVPDGVKMVPSKLCAILFDEERVTILQMFKVSWMVLQCSILQHLSKPTPSLMHYIGQDLIRSKLFSKDSSLRVLAFGGESCPTLSTLRKWRPPGSSSTIYNLYGITEVSCWASCHLIPNEKLEEEETGVVDHHDGHLMGEDASSFPDNIVNDIPLGLPLSDTVIEIRDENGELVDEGMGQIYIGGPNRVCLLGDETSPAAGTLRATGDWVYLKDCCIWFCGRRDRQIKRMGKRINLDWAENEISEKLLNGTCSLVSDKSTNTSHSVVHLFVVDNSLSCDDEKVRSLRDDLLNLLPVDGQPDFIHVVSHLPMTAHGKIDRNALLSNVQEMSISVAADMKSSREFLKYAWQDSLMVNEGRKRQDKITSGKFKKEPGKFIGENITEDDIFVASGGTSLGAVKLADSIESWMSKQCKKPVQLPELLDIILKESFSTLCSYIESKCAQMDRQDGLDFEGTPRGYISAGSSGAALSKTAVQHRGDEELSLGLISESGSISQANKKALKRKLLPLAEASFLRDEKDARTKRAMMRTPSSEEKSHSYKDETFEVSELKSCFCSVRRGNQWTVCKFCAQFRPRATCYMAREAQTLISKQMCVQASAVSTELVTDKNHSQSLSSVKDAKPPGASVTITCQWRTCLYKCIDASPLVVYSPGRCEGEVFIGSHSHVFMCIRFSDGEVLWESRVGDRIESSAALSTCGKYVVVGCYDCKVYVFNRFTGETHWTFQTGAAVKSCPCVDPKTGGVWVGSHDHHLYGLDVKHKQCICVIDCGGGSCFSSPCISSKPHLVFIATLAGHVLAVDPAEHTILWSQQCPKPVFASLLLIPTGIVCACVDGFLYCFNFQGKELWRFGTQAAVFCSPSFISTEYELYVSGYVLFGCHDKCVYCLSIDGTLQWSFTTDAQVYSSPFVAEVNVNDLLSCHATCDKTHSKKCDLSDAQMAVFVFSTVGTLYILELHSGVLLGSYSLPGEVFSSPVVVDKRILVGCRNDYLYSLDMSNAN